MTSKYFVFIIMAIIFVACFSILQAATLEVPGTYATIQDAIDAASNGDTVNVAAGSYSGYGNEDINTLGKAILVKGVPGSTSCGRFVINTGEDTTTVIHGFTVLASTYIGSSSPIIECCSFDGGPVWEGGGILISGGNPIIRRCSFIGCKANKGGAIYCGGGSLTLFQSYFFYCIAIDTFNLHHSYEGKGGAIYASYAELEISQCSFKTNTANALIGHIGGKGGAIYLDNSSATVDSSVFSNNFVSNYGTDPYGGAIYSIGNSTAEFTNATFMQNYAARGSAYYQNAGCMASFKNCLVWENTNGPNIYSCEPSSEIYITCCNFSPLTWTAGGCILNWRDTLGNMSVEPIYCSVNYSHDPNSPCLPNNNSCGVRIGAIGETGDANLDDGVNLLDVLYLINYVYNYNPFDFPPMSVLHKSKSVDCNGEVNLLDIICLMNHLYYDSCDLCDCD